MFHNRQLISIIDCSEILLLYECSKGKPWVDLLEEMIHVRVAVEKSIRNAVWIKRITLIFLILQTFRIYIKMDANILVLKNVRLFRCCRAACPVLTEHPVRRWLSIATGTNWAIDVFLNHGIMVLRLLVGGIRQRWRATWAAHRVLRESGTMTVSLFLRFAGTCSPWYHSPGKTNAINSGVRGRALISRKLNATAGDLLGYRTLFASRCFC